MGNTNLINNCPLLKSDERNHTAASTIAELKTLVQEKPEKRTLEEIYKRATFWMAPETKQKIDTLAKATGLQKYMILEKAVELFYNQIFEE